MATVRFLVKASGVFLVNNCWVDNEYGYTQPHDQ